MGQLAARIIAPNVQGPVFGNGGTVLSPTRDSFHFHALQRLHLCEFGTVGVASLVQRTGRGVLAQLTPKVTAASQDRTVPAQHHGVPPSGGHLPDGTTGQGTYKFGVFVKEGTFTGLLRGFFVFETQ